MPFERQLDHAAAVFHKNFMLRQEIKANRRFIALLLDRLGGEVAISEQVLETIPDQKILIQHDALTGAYIIKCQPIQNPDQPNPTSASEEQSSPKVVPICKALGAHNA
jgi:hypothetical protein